MYERDFSISAMQNSRRGKGSVKWEWTGLWIWKWDVEVGMTSIRRLVFDVLDGGGTWQPTKRGAIRLQMGVQHGVIMKTREKKSSEHTKHGSLLGAKKKNETEKRGRQPLSIVANCRRFRRCHHYLLFELCPHSEYFALAFYLLILK